MDIARNSPRPVGPLRCGYGPGLLRGVGLLRGAVLVRGPAVVRADGAGTGLGDAPASTGGLASGVDPALLGLAVGAELAGARLGLVDVVVR